MEEEKLVTIVLPIYNVEKYLNRCIEAIINQTYKNLEIILVDDESPDNCPKICDDWSKRDSRIKVIHKENAGLGMARNTGIENATGEYILFIDSDDYIAENAVEKLYFEIEKTGADLALFGLNDVSAEGRITKTTVPNMQKVYYSGDEIEKIVLPNLMAPDFNTGKKSGLCMSAWACMYSVELIRKNEWRFVSEREYISEDFYSLLVLYKNVKSVVLVDKALYYHCENDSSLTHTYRADRFTRNKECYNGCIKICEGFGYSDEIKQGVVYQFVSNIIGEMKTIAVSNMTVSAQIDRFKGIVIDPEFHFIINGFKLKKDSYAKKILIHAMRRKWYIVTYLLVKLKK